MDARYINPFIQSAISMIKTLTNIDFNRGKLNIKDGHEIVNGVATVIKIQSKYITDVVYDFSEILANKVTETMNGINKDDVNKTQFDIMFDDTILELSNLISGRAITLLFSEKIDCNVSPPEIIRGIGTIIAPEDKKVIVLPLSSNYGDLSINVSLFQ